MRGGREATAGSQSVDAEFSRGPTPPPNSDDVGGEDSPRENDSRGQDHSPPNRASPEAEKAETGALKRRRQNEKAKKIGGK